MRLISHCLTPCKQLTGIRILIGIGNRWRSLFHSVIYPQQSISEASPKVISRRTSYIPARLEFLPYPQVITVYFNRRVFGPPQSVTSASTCPWIARQVSGLWHATKIAQLRLAFASAPWHNHLTLLHAITRRPVLQKVRDCTWHCCRSAISACKHMVLGSISLPFRGSFQLSLTVLYAIGH